MASATTERKIALVSGPSWWGDDWHTRAGQRLPGNARAAYEQRVAEAAAEAAGLLAELDRLTPGVSLLLAGKSGATRLASVWADDHQRLTVRVPSRTSQAAEAEDLAVEVALAMAAAGRLVRAFVCVATPDDPALTALADRGVEVRPVFPLFPAPAVGSAEGEPEATSGAV